MNIKRMFASNAPPAKSPYGCNLVLLAIMSFAIGIAVILAIIGALVWAMILYDLFTH